MEDNPMHTTTRLQPGTPSSSSPLRQSQERTMSTASRLASFDAFERQSAFAVKDDIPAIQQQEKKKLPTTGFANSLVERVFGVDTSYVLDLNESIKGQMYHFTYIGLYAHYAGVGITGGMLGVATNFCFYYFHGKQNVCANAASLAQIPWGLKIFYAIGTDSWRPYGYRRKVYMILGWIGVLLSTFILSVASDSINARTWIGINLVIQAFLMLADVPADGYSVEIGQLEKPEERGQVLATGQRIRFFSSILGGLIQALLVNGPTTNAPGCPIQAQSCWAWGLTPNQYYALNLCILIVLVFPVFFLKEIDLGEDDHGVHSFEQHRKDIWDTMMNPTTMYLLIFVTGNNAFSGMGATVATYISYDLIQLSNLQAGISSILSGGALVSGIMIFQRYFINRNWRMTQYLSSTLSTLISLVWIPVYYNSAGTMNAWFTIFLGLTLSLVGGLCQVLFAMAVIELAKKGQEAISYELVISTANSASALSSIISTQLLTPFHANTCMSLSGKCPNDEVNMSSMKAYRQTNGPSKFTKYSLLIFGINLFGILVFTQFLPRQKDQCREWRDEVYDEKAQLEPIRSIADLPKLLTRLNALYVRNRVRVGQTSLAIATTIIMYDVASAIALLNPNWSCSPAFGGSGCSSSSS